MARVTRVIMRDDIDPTVEADETVRFGLDGKYFEVDLSTAHADEFRSQVEEYVKVSRRINGNTVKSGQRKVRTSRVVTVSDSEVAVLSEGPSLTPQFSGVVEPDPKTVRAWAKATNHEVADRGRIKSELMTKFLVATASR